MILEKEDKDAVLEHCEKLNDMTNKYLFGENQNTELVTLLTQSENIILNLVYKLEKEKNEINFS